MTKDPDSIRIIRCPTCGSTKIRRVTRDISGTSQGRPYVAKKVSFEQCPVCGEQLFDHAAMLKLQAARTHLRPANVPKKTGRKPVTAAS